LEYEILDELTGQLVVLLVSVDQAHLVQVEEEGQSGRDREVLLNEFFHEIPEVGFHHLNALHIVARERHERLEQDEQVLVVLLRQRLVFQLVYHVSDVVDAFREQIEDLVVWHPCVQQLVYIVVQLPSRHGGQLILLYHALHVFFRADDHLYNI